MENINIEQLEKENKRVSKVLHDYRVEYNNKKLELERLEKKQSATIRKHYDKRFEK